MLQRKNVRGDVFVIGKLSQKAEVKIYTITEARWNNVVLVYIIEAPVYTTTSCVTHQKQLISRGGGGLQHQITWKKSFTSLSYWKPTCGGY